MNEQKFIALQILAEDFSTSGSGLFIPITDKIDLDIHITKAKKVVEVKTINTNKVPVKRMNVTFPIDILKRMGYTEFSEIIDHMVRSVA